MDHVNLGTTGLRVLAVDAVADAAQNREVAQVLRRGGYDGH